MPNPDSATHLARPDCSFLAVCNNALTIRSWNKDVSSKLGGQRPGVRFTKLTFKSFPMFGVFLKLGKFSTMPEKLSNVVRTETASGLGVWKGRKTYKINKNQREKGSWERSTFEVKVIEINLHFEKCKVYKTSSAWGKIRKPVSIIGFFSKI